MTIRHYHQLYYYPIGKKLVKVLFKLISGVCEWFHAFASEAFAVLRVTAQGARPHLFSLQNEKQPSAMKTIKSKIADKCELLHRKTLDTIVSRESLSCGG